MTDFKMSEPQIGQQGGIYRMQTPQLPEFRFEYHPASKRVFSVRIGPQEFGQPIADNIGSVLDARHVVLYWSRGYMEGKASVILGRAV